MSAPGLPVSPPPAPPATDPPAKPVNWQLIATYGGYILWVVAVVAVIGLVGFKVTHDGVVDRFPDLGEKISKTMAFLKKSPTLSRMDYGHVIVLGFIVGVVLCWEHALLFMIKPDAGNAHGWDSARYKGIVLALAVAVIAADAYFFHAAVIKKGWAQATTTSVASVMLTVGYVALLIGAGLVSINIKKKIQQVKEEER
jgi:hypothetical protein